MSGADTLTRPSTLAQIGDAEPQAGGRWELRIRMEFESIDDVEVRAMVDFVQLGNQFAGQTEATYYFEDREGPAFDADFEGDMTDTDVRLDMTFLEGELAGTPYNCKGSAETKGKRYTGRWHMPCLDPVECACEGDDGDFTLTRIG